MSRLRRWFLPVSLLILLWAAFVVPFPLMLHIPDDPRSLDEVVVLDLEGSELNGDYLLSIVRTRQGTVAGLVQASVLEGVRVQPVARVIPPGEDYGAYFARQRDVFAVAGEVAAAVGLRAAGYDADPERMRGSGVLVVDVVPGAPADGVLRSGDVIVAVDERSVGVVDDLRSAILGGSAGPRSVRFLRDDESHEAELEPVEMDTAEGPVQGIGVRIQTHEPRIDLPAPVEIESGGIGGPSAGLMIALTVYDKAARDVDLAAGRTIAGTGTMGGDGTVGSVGSIEQKVLAAHRLGVDVFLVPASQLERAELALPAGSPLQIVGVSTFDEALKALTPPTASAGTMDTAVAA